MGPACPPPGSCNWVLRSFGTTVAFRAHWDNEALTFAPTGQSTWLIPWFAVWRYKPA